MLREGKPIVSSTAPIEGRSARGLARRMAPDGVEGGRSERDGAPPRSGGLAALGRAVKALLAPARPP
ncbi:hypothetical protein [Salinarimonas sp.]|uniref:hypothetical protein n=1 Tax=Salinarimonas sp. TaxID=2766526 RepID=UPI0032D8F3D2